MEGPLLSPTPRLKTGVARTPVLAFQRPRKERTACSTYQNWYAPESHQPGPASRLSHKLKFDVTSPQVLYFPPRGHEFWFKTLACSIFFAHVGNYAHIPIVLLLSGVLLLILTRYQESESFPPKGSGWLVVGNDTTVGPVTSACWLQIDFLSQIPRQSPPLSWLRRGELEYLTGYLFEIPLRQLKGLKLEPSKTVHNVCPLVCNCLVMTRQLWNSLINYTSSFVDFKTPEPCRSGV